MIRQIIAVMVVSSSLLQIGQIAFSASANLIHNPSVETVSVSDTTKPDGWATGKWGTNTTTFSYVSTGAYDGTRAIKIATTAYTSGDAKWIPNEIPVTPGKTYTFSHAYQSNVTTSLDMRYTSTSGVVSYKSLAGTLPVANTWKTDSYTFTVPSGMKSVTFMHLLEKVGTLTTDAYSLVDQSANTTDTTKPTVSIISPVASTTLSGSVTINVQATDNIGVTGVKFYLDGSQVGSEDITSPYQTIWNTSSSTNGVHSLFAVARDAQGNSATSTAILININNLVAQTGTITIAVSVVNDNGGTKQVANFPISINGNTFTSGVAKMFPVGSYVITKVTDAQYTSSFSGNCDTNGSFTLNANAQITCTLTYNDIAQTPPPVDPNNLILNPSFETPTSKDSTIPQNWNRSGWGTNTRTLTYPVAGENGGKATRVEITSYTDGDVKWSSDTINNVTGKRYRLTQRYRANVPTYVDVRYVHANGDVTYEDIGQRIEGDGTWKTFEADFEVPQDVISLKVMAILNSVGYLEVDSMSLIERPRVSLSSGTITLEFDDGYASVYQYAIPILNARGIRSTQAIISDYLGGLYVTKAQMLEMQSQGHEIASHTRTHAHLTEITQSEAVDEISNSKSRLQSLGANVSTFVYPYGEYNASVEQIVRNAGYIGARTVNFGFNNKDTNKFELRDYHIESDTSIASVKQLINQAIANDTWLVFELHQQKQNCADDLYCNTPAFLTELADYIVQSGINVVTLKEGVEQMSR
jgi:peptidoglycan/xylan/chitin deacetylase (PgdA/CDA1 family)